MPITHVLTYMKQDLHTIMTSAIVEPRADLTENIIYTIEKHNARSIARKFWASVILTIASIGGLVPAFLDLKSKLVSSGFYEYVALAFSKGGIISKYSGDVAIALGESLPAISIIISLSVLAVLLWSLRNVFRQSRSPYFNVSTN